jgi:hypothetical protein
MTGALDPYQRFDPAGWVQLYSAWPFWGGPIAIAVGVLMMLFGSGRLFRFVAGPLGAALAFLWGGLLAVKLGFAGAASTFTNASAVGLLVLGLAYPPGALFFIFGIPGGLIGGEMAGTSDWLIGFFPGFIIVGALAAGAHRYIGAVASSLAGAWLIVLGLLALLSPIGGVSSSLAAQPWGCIIAALLFAIAGVVFQLFVRLSPEERAKISEQKRQAKRRRDEQKAVEERWKTYSKDKGLDT